MFNVAISMEEISREYLINYGDLMIQATQQRERKGGDIEMESIPPTPQVTPWKGSTDREESQNETMHSKDCDFHGQKPGYKLRYY